MFQVFLRRAQDVAKKIEAANTLIKYPADGGKLMGDWKRASALRNPA